MNTYPYPPGEPRTGPIIVLLSHKATYCNCIMSASWSCSHGPEDKRSRSDQRPHSTPLQAALQASQLLHCSYLWPCGGPPPRHPFVASRLGSAVQHYRCCTSAPSVSGVCCNSYKVAFVMHRSLARMFGSWKLKLCRV